MEHDLIDFPCSDAFLDFYHERGMTPRHTPNYGHGTDLPPLAALDADIAVLRKQVGYLRAKLAEVEARARQRRRVKPAAAAPALAPQEGVPEFEV